MTRPPKATTSAKPKATTSGKSTTAASKKKPLKAKENVSSDDDRDGDDTMDVEDDNFGASSKPRKPVLAPQRQGQDASDKYQAVSQRTLCPF